MIFKRGEEPKRMRKVASLLLYKGDKVSLRSGGGGGWGNPAERDPNLVLNDVLNEYISVEDAEKIYKVKIKETNGIYEIDWEGTKKIRINK